MRSLVDVECASTVVTVMALLEIETAVWAR